MVYFFCGLLGALFGYYCGMKTGPYFEAMLYDEPDRLDDEEEAEYEHERQMRGE